MKADAFDTSVVVPALLVAHPRHAFSRELLVRALGGSVPPILPVPVRVESYSVLTRMPGGLRAEIARDALVWAFRGRVNLMAVEDELAWAALEAWPGVGAVGGRASDALVLACVRKAGAARLWTYSVNHFRGLDVREVEVVAPG